MIDKIDEKYFNTLVAIFFVPKKNKVCKAIQQ